MELFDKQYIYFEWDDKLKDVEAFAADSLAVLKLRVENGENYNLCKITKNQESVSFPFMDTTSEIIYEYVYYDPLYKYKYAYYIEGKIIEWFDDYEGKWVPFTVEPLWGDNVQYRIQEEEEYDDLCTYRQLAEWLAKGNGELFFGGIANISLSYPVEKADDCLDKPYMIRKWDDKEWHEPFLSYMNMKAEGDN